MPLPCPKKKAYDQQYDKSFVTCCAIYIYVYINVMIQLTKPALFIWVSVKSAVA